MNNNDSFNNNNNDTSFEEEILDNRGVSNVEDDDVQMIRPKMGRNRKSYVEKVNKLAPKNFKLRRTIIAIVCVAVISLSFIISSSFANMTSTSKTNNTSKLEAGTMKLEFSKGSSAINLVDALPQNENDAILNNDEYLFTVSNTGDLTSEYTIMLNNTCDTDKTYKINKEKIKPDMCIPDKYLTVGISVNDSDYRVITKDETSNSYVIDKRQLNPNAVNKYKMKVWLALETPNDYNAKNGEKVFYSGNINIVYNQVEKEEPVNSTLDTE